MENSQKMKRYLINEKLRNSIRNSKYSMRQMSKVLGFHIKNIYIKNRSINEEHLKKIKDFLEINPNLKEIELNHIKNLGKYAVYNPIKLPKIRYDKKGTKEEDMAEFIGIMLGDGSFYGNTVRIAFDKRNINYIKHVEDLFYKIFKIELKKYVVSTTNQAYLYRCNKNVAYILQNLGLKRGNKIKNQVGIPGWIKQNKKFSRRCIRGLIDTDGCIYTCKRERQTYIKFTNHSLQLLNDFKEINNNLGYSFVKSGKTNTAIYKKEQVVRFIKGIKPLKYMGL